MSARTPVAIDLGGLTVKIATDRGVTPIPTAAEGPVGALRTALAQAPVPASVCIAAPDAWLTGHKPGAARQEDVRHECEDIAQTGQVVWVGQLAAVSAFAAATRGSGRYLICDVGGTGVRAGTFTVSGATVRVEAIHAEAGGGRRDFDAAIRSQLPALLAPSLPVGWHDQAMGDKVAARAARVLEKALTRGLDDDLKTRVYRIAGVGVLIDLSACLLIESFDRTARRLRDAVTAVLGGRRPDHIVLTGGLGWFPLTARTAASAAGVAVAGAVTMGVSAPGVATMVTAPDATARGALLFARGDFSLAPSAGREPVAIPVNRFRDGLLEEVRVTLPWTESFAEFPGGMPTIGSEELEVLVGGKPRAAPLRGLVRGPHQIGLRAAWPGPGVLVVRPVDGGEPYIIPLTDLAAR